MEIKYKIWVERKQSGKVFFGKGREDILKAIGEEHSLNAAAKKLGMSYRAAWGRLKASEERLGMKLVDINPSEKTMQLTDQAKAMIDLFEKLEKDVEQLLQTAENDFQKLLQDKKIKP